MEFGQLLRQLRHARGYSLTAVAFDVGVTEEYLSGIERGRLAPLTPERLERACASLCADAATQVALRTAAARGRGCVRLSAGDDRRASLAAEIEHAWDSDTTIASLEHALRNGG